MPAVSVIIPVWNGSSVIARAVQSVLAQSLSDFEIIVADDGSTDDTVRELGRFNGRLRLLRQSNLGPSAARNAGARSAAGRYLAFLDADDVWMPAMLAQCVAALDADPKTAVAYTNAVIVDPAGDVVRPSMVPPDRAHDPSMDELLSNMWPIVPSAAIVRRTAFEAIGGFCETLRSCEDVYFWLLAREQGTFRYLPECLVRKTEEEVYPKVLDRDAGAAEFINLVRGRFGARANGLVRSFTTHKARLLSHTGLIALSRGHQVEARRCFARAIGYDPMNFRNYSRLLKTFLRPEIARALSGKAAARLEW